MATATLLSAWLAIGAAADIPDLSARPLPASGLRLERLAIGSCYRLSRGGREIWGAIAEQNPQLFIFAGDTLYPPVSSADPRVLADSYAALAADPAFAGFRRKIPVLPVWDDHDYGENDGGANYPFREESEALFEAAWRLPARDQRLRRPGVYLSRVFGPPGERLQLIVLDTRFFRSPLRDTDQRGARGKERYLPDPDSGKTLLGAAQWRWLEAQMAQPAALRIIVSSIQVLADGHGWEGWRLLPGERERLYSLLRSHDHAPTLLLSGDRHVSGFYELDIGTASPLLEFTASPLNNTIPEPYRASTLAEDGPNRLGELYGEANFGIIDIDWPRRMLAMSIRDSDGVTVRTLERAFSRRPAGDAEARDEERQ
jgi:alkaline phosphatase D